MTKHFKTFFNALTTAFDKWWEKDPFKESAVIAYYAIFALPGLLVVIVIFAEYLFGQEAVNGQIAGKITATLGAETAYQIQDIIVRGTMSKNSMWATIFGILTIIVGATGVFAQFQKSLNTIWHVKADETKSGIWSLVKVRLFSFGVLIAVDFILIVSLVISATLSLISTWVTYHFSESLLIVLQIVNIVISFLVLTSFFAIMFKYIPDAKIKWRHVWNGSLVTAFLFEIGKTGLGLYFGKVNPGSGYGAAGSIILILLWVSYSSMIVLYGAEFTHAYAEIIDGPIQPSEIAVKEDENKV